MTILQRFFRDRRGNVAVIVALLILPMLVLAGGATDIARYEAHRVQLQDGVDRAALAAASLSQTKSVQSTVNSYMKSISFIGDVDLDYDSVISINARKVTVTASYPMQTGFLPLIGISELNIVVSATAEDRRPNIEISLMLDISGSMRWGTPTRLSLLRPAAKEFIDTILTPASAPTTSISIVPYAGSVNPGSAVFNGLGVPRKHNYSSCVEFANNDYGVGMIPLNQRTQVPHFTNSHDGVNEPGLEWSWCPYEATSITYLSNNAATLKAKIDGMRMHDGTGTAIAMNWGMLLLEPSAQPFIAQAAGAGIVPMQFANRPAAFNNGGTVKVIVLMTDGIISQQLRPHTYNYPRNPAVNNYEMQSSQNAAQKMQTVCDRAKANNVIVYTIGFQLEDEGKVQMRNCASSAGHYYDVVGLDIASAFRAVANSIQKVKLTQ